MKKTLIFVFALTSLGLYGQNIGINLLNPEYTLDVRSGSVGDAGQLNVSNQDKSRYLRFFSGSDAFPDPSLAWNPGHSFLFATYNDATFEFTEYLRIHSDGNIGIRMPNPEANLDIKGGDWNLEAGNPGDVRVGNASYNFRIGVATGGGGAGITRLFSSSQLRIGTADEVRVTLDTEGEVGFGTTNPTQKVHVNGKLKIGDDAKAPSEGTIRYNSATKKFEGYDGTKWINLGGSNPYGNFGEFNLPNDKLNGISMPGDIVGMVVTDGYLAFSSLNEEIVGVNSSFPFDPIYDNVRYIDLYSLDTDGTLDLELSLNSLDWSATSSLGAKLALSSSRFLISNIASNEVLEYTKTSSSWLFSNTFESPDSSIDEKFGSSIDIDGQKTIIGAPASGSFFEPAEGPGKAYVYAADDSLEGTLSGSAAEIGDQFGSSVSLSGTRALVGAPSKQYNTFENAGSATVFNFFNGNWSTNNTFYDETPAEDENFGISVDVQNSDYLYIQTYEEGIVNYAVENGFWELKETIEIMNSELEISSFRNEDYQTLLANSYDPFLGAFIVPYLSIYERATDNNFSPLSFLINGTTSITSYGIMNNKVYTLGSDDQVYVFDY